MITAPAAGPYGHVGTVTDTQLDRIPDVAGKETMGRKPARYERDQFLSSTRKYQAHLGSRPVGSTCPCKSLYPLVYTLPGVTT